MFSGLELASSTNSSVTTTAQSSDLSSVSENLVASRSKKDSSINFSNASLPPISNENQINNVRIGTNTAQTDTHNEGFYQSQENAIEIDLQNALQKIKQCNSVSVEQIDALEKKLKYVEMENVDLKNRIDQLEREKAIWEEKAAEQEAGCKKCEYCNKLLDTPTYCDKKCHDDRLSQLMSNLSQS